MKISDAKILHFCAVDFTVRHFVAPLVRDQEKHGAKVIIACSKGDEWDGLVESRLDMRDIPMPRNLSPGKLLRAFFALFRLLKKEQPDVLYLHTPLASLVGRLAGRCAGIPTIIYHVHGFYFHDRMASKPKFAHVTLERLFAPLAHAMFFVSKEDMQTARRVRMKKKARLFHTPNGVDPTLYDQKGDGATETFFTNEDNRIVVTFMGRLTEEKGIFGFLEAIEKLNGDGVPVLGVLAGPVLSSERDSVQKKIDDILAKPESENCIQQIGYCQNVPALLMKSDIFCLPSWREGLPVSIIEAMMAGLPVVTTDVRGCRELVRDGVNGFITGVQKPGEIAGAISLLVRHPKLRKKMGEIGRKRAEKYYSKRRSLDSVHNSLAETIRGRR